MSHYVPVIQSFPWLSQPEAPQRTPPAGGRTGGEEHPAAPLLPGEAAASEGC